MSWSLMYIFVFLPELREFVRDTNLEKHDTGWGPLGDARREKPKGAVFAEEFHFLTTHVLKRDEVQFCGRESRIAYVPSLAHVRRQRHTSHTHTSQSAIKHTDTLTAALLKL